MVLVRCFGLLCHWLLPAAKEFYFSTGAPHQLCPHSAHTNETMTMTTTTARTNTIAGARKKNEAKNSFTNIFASILLRASKLRQKRRRGARDAGGGVELRSRLWHTHQYHLSSAQHNLPFWLPPRFIVRTWFFSLVFLASMGSRWIDFPGLHPTSIVCVCVCFSSCWIHVTSSWRPTTSCFFLFHAFSFSFFFAAAQMEIKYICALITLAFATHASEYLCREHTY